VKYSRQHEAAERAALRRWLRMNGYEPCCSLYSTGMLIKQVSTLGGDFNKLMEEACKEVDRKNIEKLKVL